MNQVKSVFFIAGIVLALIIAVLSSFTPAKKETVTIRSNDSFVVYKWIQGNLAQGYAVKNVIEFPVSAGGHYVTSEAGHWKYDIQGPVIIIMER